MIQLQSQVEHSIIAFKPRSIAVWTFSARDRLDLAHMHDSMRLRGYRTVLYEREPGDSPDVGCFLSIYRNAEPWALWSMARRGARLSVWCGRTSQDIGVFTSVPEVLAALLPDCMNDVAENDQEATGMLITLCRVS